MTISKSKVAIVIPSAGGSVLRKCVKTIFLNTIIDFKLFIVCQGELGDVDYCNELLEKYPNKVYVHFNKVNEPGSQGYNKGILLAIRNYIFNYLLFLDDDILVLKKGWLNKLVLFLDNNKDVGIVGYKMCSLAEPDKDGNILEFMSCCMLVTKQLILSIGLMDETLLWHRNDSDYYYMAWKAGFKVKVIYANDNKDMSNDYLYHSHQIGTNRLKNEKELREKTYVIFDDKWKNKVPKIF